MKDVWDRAKTDEGFRKKLLQDPKGTLNGEGLDEINDFVNTLTTSDPSAIEEGLKSGESNPSC